jgi:acetyltransferase-like isoleucine patch superfamily enzyme
MLKYLLGLIKNLLNGGVSLFALIDTKSLISHKAKVNWGVKFYDSSIDSYSYVGPGSVVVCTDIGKFCSIADNCSIGLATHSIKYISTSPLFTSIKNGTGSSWSSLNTFHENFRVAIGNDVWIGTKVIIMGGVRIGDGAIVGAGALVTKDIPDYAIAVGCPAKVIKYRFDKPIIEKLAKIQWWNFSDGKLKEKIDMFQTENFGLEDLDKI